MGPHIKNTPLTTNSGGGLGTEGACPHPHSRSQTRERGHTETLHYYQQLPPKGLSRGRLGLPYTRHQPGGRCTLAPPSANPENVEPEAGGNKTADKWAIETFIAARSDSTVTNLLAQGASEVSSCQQECFSLEPPDNLAHFFSLTEHFSASFTNAWNWRGKRWEHSLHQSLAEHMAGQQDTQRECGSKESPSNYLSHPTQL
ncbi:hypothetical protein E2C01_022896 [Portunus trituberculatus]|uniref:Uncharacterized protein n=1 Tax=Portunus trituberculatus TaxID=210409 RepID=A0A5B7E6L6_PORTR|nr:hypothetical protein [Portunus trituberculatus]